MQRDVEVAGIGLFGDLVLISGPDNVLIHDCRAENIR